MAYVCPVSLSASELPQLPIAMNVVRRHCHIYAIDESPETDVLIATYLKAAVNWFEGETFRSVLARSHRWTLREFPYEGDAYGNVGIRLPGGKTQSVDSITYTSVNITNTLTGPSASPPGTAFRQDLNDEDGGYIYPPYGGSWPSTDLDGPAPVVINFTAGWLLNQIPAVVQQALMFYVSDAFELRGTSDLDTAGANLWVRTALISPYRLIRWY